MTEDALHSILYDSKGRVVIRFGLIGTLYFPEGHSAAKRSAVLDCFREYDAQYGAKLRWWVVEGRRFSATAKLTNRDMAPYLLSQAFEEYDRSWAFFWHGGERCEDASEYRFKAFAPAKTDSDLFGALSFLTFTLPLSSLSDDPALLPRLLSSFGGRVKAVHGYGGIGIVEAADDGVAAANENAVYALAIKHPGAEVDRPMNHALWTKNAIKGVNWLTWLSDGYLDALGGEDALRGQLSPAIKLEDVPGGVMIVAGPRPLLGDRNRQVGTPLYAEVARAVRRVQLSTHPAIARSPDGKFDADRFTAWLQRFET